MAQFIGDDAKFADTPHITYLVVTEVCPQPQHTLETTNSQKNFLCSLRRRRREHKKLNR
jgi:hypothetical protein